MTRPAGLDQLVAAWRRPVDVATRRASVALVAAVLVGTAHLARVGSISARAFAAVLVLGVGALLLILGRHASKSWQGVQSAIRRVLVPTDRVLGERALRAAALVERTRVDSSAGSPELARLHLERLVSRASVVAVERAAQRRASRLRAGFVVLALGTSVAVLLSPMRILEGLDVLIAHDGRAPIDMVWIDEISATTQPPAYLHGSEQPLFVGSLAPEPEGSTLTLRGTPVRDGRRLVLRDGKVEVPFVSDGSGGVVVRYELAHSAHLRIAARFGDVLIEQPEALDVAAEPDHPPKVTLQDAPRRLALEDLHRLELRYVATDDHGLRQVDLVLRSGGREERRVLSRLDGGSTTDRGGTVLYPSDKFLRRRFLPIVVTVEARDNDGRGSKWGSSQAITIDPPVLGAPESSRLQALEKARDEVTDLVAASMQPLKGLEPGERLRLKRRWSESARAAARSLRTASKGTYGGLRVPRGMAAFLAGQARRLERSTARPPLRTRAEDVVLAVDVALGMMATRDARAVAKRLGDVAEEAADAAHAARNPDDHRGMARLDVALTTLDAGGKALLELGDLGADLGSVTLSETRRIRRSREAKELLHAEAAARHLAARLRRPNPSFSASRRGGVESGLGGAGAGSGQASDAQDRFDQLSHELEQLAQEHAQGTTEVTDALDEAERDQDVDALKDEARRRAQAVREAIAGLPRTGQRQGAAEAAAALAREHASAMAENLEAVQLERSVQSGKDALEALAEAERKADETASMFEPLDRGALETAKREVAEQVDWAQKKLDELRRQAEAKAKPELDESARREGDLAERAKVLRETGSKGQAALPQHTTDALERAEELMRDAAKELEAGRGEQGNALQMEAQRWLEQSQPGSPRDPDDGRDGDDGDGSDGEGRHVANGKAPVPKKGHSHATEDFRQRVLHGLSQAHGDRLSPAVKRYAERLLQ